MAQEPTPKHNATAANETFVISRTEEGFRVYNPADPTRSYSVTGGPEESACTCPEFRYHEGDPNFRCKHIQVVLEKLGLAGGSASGRYEAEEREAIRNEGRMGTQDGVTHMVLKRSVSPDGRIDSLSVEFSCALRGAAADEVKTRAFDALRLQDEIVAGFLGKNGRRQTESAPAQAADGSQPARMVSIAGITTKWGRRLYIAIQANGSTLRFFGSRKQVADAIVAAGYPALAERVEEGKDLNVPCRVVTRPSEDGRYINVEQVLPAQAGRP